MNHIQTYEIIDALFGDDQSIDKISQYSTVLGTVTNIAHSSEYNSIYNNSGSWGMISPYQVNGSDDWCFEVDYMTGNVFWSIGMFESSSKHLQLLAYDTGLAPYDYGGTGRLFQHTDKSLQRNTWYRYKCEYVNGIVTVSIYDSSNNLIDSGSFTMPSYYLDKTLKLVISGFDRVTIKFKNIVIKPL